jgi:hypothetical protein
MRLESAILIKRMSWYHKFGNRNNIEDSDAEDRTVDLGDRCDCTRTGYLIQAMHDTRGFIEQRNNL